MTDETQENKITPMGRILDLAKHVVSLAKPCNDCSFLSSHSTAGRTIVEGLKVCKHRQLSEDSMTAGH